MSVGYQIYSLGDEMVKYIYWHLSALGTARVYLIFIIINWFYSKDKFVSNHSSFLRNLNCQVQQVSVLYRLFFNTQVKLIIRHTSSKSLSLYSLFVCFS